MFTVLFIWFYVFYFELKIAILFMKSLSLLFNCTLIQNSEELCQCKGKYLSTPSSPYDAIRHQKSANLSMGNCQQGLLKGIHDWYIN